MKLAVEFRNVSSGYADAEVLRQLNFAVAAGEMTALIGPNGAGKSTLFKVLTGLHPAQSGTVRIFGREVGAIDAAERARLIAVVPQELTTPMAHTVEDIVMLGRSVLLHPWQQPSDRDRQVAERAMAYTDISDLKHRTLNALSGGEKQRAVVAMALAQEPKIILMDEPTTHLDMNHAIELMQLMQRLNAEQDVTVLMISHDLNLASVFCRRLLVLRNGTLAADGTPAEVLTGELIRSVYHCDARILHDAATGAPLIVPAPVLRSQDGDSGVRVHLVAGGGSGCELLRRLCLSGHKITCGALNKGDSDALCAQALGIETALEKPFSPIGVQAVEQAACMAGEADAIILCEVPFGPGNLPNIRILEDALRRGVRTLINDRDLEKRDYTGDHSASSRIRRMLDSGAVPWQDANDIPAILAKTNA